MLLIGPTLLRLLRCGSMAPLASIGFVGSPLPFYLLLRATVDTESRAAHEKHRLTSIVCRGLKITVEKFLFVLKMCYYESGGRWSRPSSTHLHHLTP